MNKKYCIIGGGSSLARVYLEHFLDEAYVSVRTCPKHNDEFENFLSCSDF
jgi:hypothetical protein